MRNHGDSPWADEMSYVAMAGDVLAFLDRHRLKRVVVVGHSMGGKAAMTLALTHPERIKALVVVDIAPVAYGEAFQDYIEAMRSLDLTALTRRAEAEGRLQPVIPDPGILGFLLQNLVSEEGRFAWRLNLSALGSGMAALNTFPDELLDRAFEGGSLFLSGGLSDYIRPEHHADIYRLFPKAEIEDIPDAGHWIHAERPESFLAHLRSFLATAGAPEAAK